MPKVVMGLRHYCIFHANRELARLPHSNNKGKLIPHLCEHSGGSDQIKSKLGHQIDNENNIIANL